MDGLSVLFESNPRLDPLLYSRGNALGWLSRSEKTGAAPYHLSGRLYLSKSGWLLLSVPNAFVRGLFDALTAPGAELPTAGLMNVPNMPSEALNAHISVMTADEVAKIGADKINERGHMFHYGLGPVREIPVSNVDGVSKVWAVQVVSPALSALRKSYGLTPLPNGDHEFHITIAARRKHVMGNNEVSKFDAATGRGELKAAADDKTTYDCSCSGPCMCPDTCVCKKHGRCGHRKKEAADTQERVRVVLPYNGKYLLETLNNPKWPANLGKRRFIGGGIEAGETPEQAATREMFEELGVKIKPNAFKHIGNDPNKPHEHYVELAKHKIKPGNFNATVGSDAIISLAEGLPSGADYIGPDLKKLLVPALKKTAADPEQTILVSGHSGAGKSTLAKALSKKLKIPLHQIDSHPDQKAFFAVNKDGQETIVGSPEYEAFQKLRKRTAEETLAGITGPAIVEGAQLSGMSPEQLSLYKKRIFVHTPLEQLLKQRLERQRSRQIAKGNEWTPELEAKKQRIGRAVYDSQNDLMSQYAKIPGTLKYTTHKDDINKLLANLKKTAADLLPGGEADNMPDSKFPPKALAEGKKHEHEHTRNDQIAKEIAKDHLQEDPKYYEKVRKIEGTENEKSAEKEPAVILQLRQAKEHSDAKRYRQKNEILRKLMHRAPEEWFVDDPTKYHMGITHAPTSFRFHADPRIIPVGVPVQKAASKNPYMAQLLNLDLQKNVPAGSSIGQRIFSQFRQAKQLGDWKVQADQNAQNLFAAMDPNYRAQRNAATVRGVWPQPDMLTTLIQNYGDRALGAFA